MAGRYRQLKRATVARSALDIIAMIFIGCAFAFWFAAFWQMLAPPILLGLGTVSVLVLTLVYSLAAPLLLSMLVPTTPAGQLLQKTQWRTIGFPVIVMAALFLCWQGFTLIGAWLSAQGGINPATGQPALQATGQVLPMAISLTIAFILIPALAWIQVSPELWLQQIQQAHMVKKLQIQQAGEIAIIRNQLIWLEQKALVGYANLLPDEQRAVLAGAQGLIQGINDQQRAIARTMSIHADVERDFMGDAEIEQAMRQVAQATSHNAIAQAPSQIDAPATIVMPDRAPSPPERAEAAPDPRVAVRPPDAARDEAYTVAFEAYGRDQAWTVRELAGVLSVAESTARAQKITWENTGIASGVGLSNGRYRFV